jgi:simple sugar transport system ATP-binding protein
MLELRQITKRFGPVLANNQVDITVAAGTIHAIVGENGAGKSTAMRIAYGFYTPDSGDVIIDGQRRAIANPHDAIALGVGMVHQHFMLVDTMTVTENIVLGAEPGTPVALNVRDAARHIRQLSHDFKLVVDPDAVVEQLSVGEQQRVELLKALYRDARLLILDEPTAVLTPPEVAEFFAVLRQMRDRGKTIVIITHKLSEVLAISDEVTVMRDGRVVGRLHTSQTSATELARLMVGRDVLLRVNKTPASPGAPMLTVEDLTIVGSKGRTRVDHVSFTVRASEIVGIAGVEGNGQTELIDAIAGLTAAAQTSGDIAVAGRSIVRLTPRERRDLGVAHVPEDRHKRGVLLDFTVADNAILGAHHRLPTEHGGHVLLNDSAIRRRAQAIVAAYDVRPTDIDLPARALSGGNQQKLIIGREGGSGDGWHPRLLIVAQPTRGVDIGAIEFIHRKLVEQRDAGCAVLLISAELEEVTSLSDRVLVMHNGRIAGEVDPAVATTEEIGLLMTGGR